MHTTYKDLWILLVKILSSVHNMIPQVERAVKVMSITHDAGTCDHIALHDEVRPCAPIFNSVSKKTVLDRLEKA